MSNFTKLDLKSQLQLASKALGWSHQDLRSQVSNWISTGPLAGDVPAQVPSEVVAERRDGQWQVRLEGQPVLKPKEGGGRLAEQYLQVIEQRGERLCRLTETMLQKPRYVAADLACDVGIHVSVVEAIVSHNVVTVDGVTVPFTERVDVDSEVVCLRDDSGLQGLFFPAMEPQLFVGDEDDSEWPDNVLSRKTRLLEGGVFCKQGFEPQSVRYLPAHRRTAGKLLGQLLQTAEGLHVGFGSESKEVWQGWACLSPPASVFACADEAAVRELFAQTICPVDRVQVRALGPKSDGENALLDGRSSEDAQRVKQLVEALSDLNIASPSLVEVGFFGRDPNVTIPPPPGFLGHGSFLPRVIMGISPEGSLISLVSFAVWT